MTRLSTALEDAIGDKSVQEFSTEHGLPYWVVRDLLTNRTSSCRAKYVKPMARAIGIQAEALLDLMEEAEAELPQEVSA